MATTPFIMAQNTRNRRNQHTSIPSEFITPSIEPISINNSPEPSIPSELLTLTPTPTSVTIPLPLGATTGCIFEIQWKELKHEGKYLVEPYYRLRNKRHLKTRFLPSGIFRHGVDIADAAQRRFWVCRTCHVQKRYAEGVFPSELTTGAIRHLRKWHNIVVDKLDDRHLDHALPASPFEAARYGTATPSFVPTTAANLGNSRTPVDSEKYKQMYIDWVIAESITF